MNSSVPFPRRQFLKTTAAFAAAASLPWASPAAPPKRIPVILDTDIGDDIDDTWALGFLLKCPELDLKLAVGEYGKAQYRAKLLAKFLQTVGHAHVPVGIGLDIDPKGTGGQAECIAGYDLKSYPGSIREDGVQAIIDTIMDSKETVTLICIGPMPNVAAAFAREPRIAGRARFVGMQGSIRIGYDGTPKPAPEWNVKAAPKACRDVFAAQWKDMTITPLDTCGRVKLDGDRYQRVLHSRDPIARAVIDNYRVWSRANHFDPSAPDHHSSTLFDTVAVYLACSHVYCRMEKLGLAITDDGLTTVDPGARQINVATSWKDMDGFYELLANRLAG